MCAATFNLILIFDPYAIVIFAFVKIQSMNNILDPVAEAQRLENLNSYNILDSLSEQDYDNITLLASIICDVPISLISLIDEERQWFKSHRGIEATETERQYSFCAHALNKPEEPLIVTDSRLDDRFKDNPFVTGDPNVVFYAGIPLVSEAGHTLGTVCVLDNKTRQLSNDQINSLKALSKQTMNLLELRKANYELQLLKMELEVKNKDLEQFAMVVSHDIKSPLASIQIANNMLTDFGATMSETEKQEFINASQKSAAKIISMVDGILSYYKGDKNIRIEKINLTDFFDGLKQTISSTKNYTLNYGKAMPAISFNRTQLEQIFFNLINNSIRYNNSDAPEINISFKLTDGYYEFSVADNGIGISAENQKKIFDLFATVNTYDNFGARGYGIGLPTVKKIIENAGGTIQVQSEPGKGTTFTFTLKQDVS